MGPPGAQPLWRAHRDVSAAAPPPPEQTKVKGAIRETIEDGLKYLSDADLEAIADYLFAQPAIAHEVVPKR